MSYIAKDTDVKAAVDDFILFCEYIRKNKPSMTQKGNLSPKTCYDINQLLREPVKDTKPTDRIEKYAALKLWFQIAKESGVIDNCSKKGKKACLDTTDLYDNFMEMNIFTQYLLIFVVWFQSVNMDSLFENKYGLLLPNGLIDTIFYQLTKDCSNTDTNKDIFTIFKISVTDIIRKAYNDLGKNLEDLALISDNQTDIVPTHLGYCIMKACYYRKHSWFNPYASDTITDDDYILREKVFKLIKSGKETFLTPFLKCFNKGEIDTSFISKILLRHQLDNNSILEFKVSFCNSCYRIIRCSPEHSFEDLHYAIQEAFEFGDDHLYSFFLDGKRFSIYAVNSPLSDESPYADEKLFKDSRLKDGQHIMYLFDYGDEWIFDITVSIISDSQNIVEKPIIIQSVGKAPDQYPSDDDDF